MGAHTRVHIQGITELPSVRDRWVTAHGRPPRDQDVEDMFQAFIPLQLACLGEYSTLIPGALDAVKAMRGRGYRIGSTTGYTTEMTKIHLADGARQGHRPDATVLAGEVPAGPPFPPLLPQN